MSQKKATEVHGTHILEAISNFVHSDIIMTNTL